MVCKIKCLKKVNDTLFLLSDGDIVNEVDLFSIVIESDRSLSEYILMLTDIPIDIYEINVDNQEANSYLYALSDLSVKNYFINQNFEDVFDLYKANLRTQYGVLPFYKLFLNYPIGRCEIKLFNQNSEEFVECLYLNVTSSKIEDEEFTLLVKFIEEKGNDVWAKYSLIKHEALSSSSEDKIEWLILFCKLFLEELKEKYLSYFEHDIITNLQSRQHISVFNEDVVINEESIVWLTQNLDTLFLTEANNPSRIIVNNRSFSPYEISGIEFYDCKDNPENRLVHGFLNELQYFLIDLLEVIEIKINDVDPILFEELIFFYASKRKISMIRLMLGSIIEMKEYFNKHIPVKVETTEFIESNRIENKNHYYFIYRKFIEWSLNKSADYTIKNNLFKGINRLDHLFERACLYKIMDDLVKLKYKLDVVKWSEDVIPLVIRFTKSNKDNYLYFQSMPSYLVTTKKGSGKLQPDFLIELHNKSIIILDAKYKKESNIARFDLPELTLKYLHGINRIEGGWNNFIGLLVLYPSKDTIKSFYHKHNYTPEGKTPVKPFIGSVGMSFQKSENQFLEILNVLME